MTYKNKYKVKYTIPNGIMIVEAGEVNEDKTYITINCQFGRKKINKGDLIDIEDISNLTKT